MANKENINNVTEGVIDVAEQVAETISVKPNNKFGVISAVVIIGGATIAGIAMGIRYIKNKKKAKEEQADFADMGDDRDMENDFEECNSK